ncbi:MAG TPA: helix-turn-helix transcriptional regulator, partial [Ktedonobacteraceae bacterium]|nr:helix-turn-helix transcriptional regulator [Ktedonobacteraceae bacterium]
METITHASFGELLRTFRKRRKLRQQELAELLGIHRNTIGTWERGDYLPEYKGIVLELARVLSLDEAETRQLLEASLTALAPHYLVPLPRNPFFTGREEVLSTLHHSLGTEQVVAVSQSYALHGLGGVGKTQIALEYAYRYALEYRAVFWIEAETSERVMSSVLRIAEVLRLPEREDADQQHSIAAVQRWLGSHQQWLVIWDNLETLDLLQSWLPLGRQGAFLLTTRHQALGTVAQGIELPELREEEGVLFVLRRAKLLEAQGSEQQVQEWAARMSEEYAAAQRLVAAMGGLPLALDQAGAYIEEMGCGMVGYLRRYEQGQARLLQRRGGPGGYHPDSVTTTFLLASERVEEECEEALALLRGCAFVHAEAIPEELFTASGGMLGSELEALAADPWRFDQAMALLRNMSLIHRQAATRTLSIHRLVQAVLREQMSESQRVLWQQRVV